MSERANIFGRIREALRVSAPPPGSRHHEKSAIRVRGRSGQAHFRMAASRGGQLRGARGNVSRERARTQGRVSTAWRAVRDEASLRELAKREGWKRVASHSGELADRARAALALPGLVTNHGYDVEELEKCDAGISECDALVAQTGSVLVSTRSSGGRALSVLPPHHLVLARRDQLLADLPEAFAFLKAKYGSNYPSFISFITGPSRTGDIERILVLGAHGPRKLTILCV